MKRQTVGLAAAVVLVAALLAYERGWGSAWFAPTPIPGDAGRAPTADPHVVRFVAVGDSGEVNAIQVSVADAIGKFCQLRPCDFGLLLGDNLYPAGPEGPDDPNLDYVFHAFHELPFPFYAVLGNHDYGDSTEEERARWEVEWARKQTKFVMPEKFYRFTAGDATFWALDTTDVFWDGPGAQGKWLDATLGETTGWRVAFGHHPYKSDAMHGNAGSYENTPLVPIASGGRLLPLFRDHLCGNVDLYLSGHDHTLQWIAYLCATLLISGSSSKPRPVEDRGNHPRFASDWPGFAWVELGEVATIAFVDGDGNVLYEGTAPKLH